LNTRVLLRWGEGVLTCRRTNIRLIDILDRILDRGIVVDPTLRLELMEIDLLRIEGRVVVASIQTYRQFRDDVEVQLC
jgi:Gas vesicle protein